MLTQHDATVNCLQFTDNHSHIISGSADGVLSIVRVGNWQLEKIWNKAHKGESVLDIALHSSSKLALTLGADCSLSTWNLVKGRRAFIVNLNSHSKDARSLEKITWANDGIRFILYGGKYTEIWSVNTGGILNVFDHVTRVSSCIWFSNDKILVGYEDGLLCLIDINKSYRQNYKAHTGRIKSLLKHKDYIISCSSTGEIKVWNNDLEELAQANTGCRLTCLSVIPVVEVKKEETEDGQKDTNNDIPDNKTIKKSTVVIEIEDDCVTDKIVKNINIGDHGYLDSKKGRKKRKLKNKTESSGSLIIRKNKYVEQQNNRNTIDKITENEAIETNLNNNMFTQLKKKKRTDTKYDSVLMEDKMSEANDTETDLYKTVGKCNKKKKHKTETVDETIAKKKSKKKKTKIKFIGLGIKNNATL